MRYSSRQVPGVWCGLAATYAIADPSGTAT